MANIAGIPIWREIGETPRRSGQGAEQVETLIVGAGPVGLTDFAGIFGGSLDGWAARLHAKPGLAAAA